ncbi:peptidyl-alpha-hydroxyglycine alpha-amidating lyase family protein [Phenylobacterium sp.]|uniref:peptidyl-alpha-hydroxyglycine alpha-amidating lyase family protein n=1 Tax=Phenylobacterium sp. TaxID=1871053 RepID=UPI0035B40141
MRHYRAALAALLLAGLMGGGAQAQALPLLDYREAPGALAYPTNWTPGEASGVAVNSKGHVFLFKRTKPMLSEFDAKGRFVRSFDDGLWDHPHGLRIDADDNLWTTDDQNHTVLKLSPRGEVLLVLGRRYQGGEADWLLGRPADVAWDKAGNIYVADGYGNSRIVKFDPKGNFLKAWGEWGDAPGQFKLPHSVVVDDLGRVIVADRENARIQVFDDQGKFLTQWTGLGYPYGLVLGPDRTLWMVDGGYDRLLKLSLDGKPLGTFGRPGHGDGEFAWSHFMALGRDQKIYVADVLNWRFHVLAPTAPQGLMSDYVPTRRRYFGSRPSKGWFTQSADAPGGGPR